MKRLVFVLLVITLIFAISSLTFASEVVVNSAEDLKYEFSSGDSDVIKLGSDIWISNDDGEGQWGPVVINGKDRTLDFNGYELIIVKNEQIKVNYLSNNSFIITDSSADKTGALCAEYDSRSYSYGPFDFVNYTYNQVQLIVNGGTFLCHSLYIFDDSSLNHFKLIINDGVFKSLKHLFYFNASFDGDVELNKMSFSLYDDSYSSVFGLTGNGRLYDRPASTRIGEGSYLFEVSGDEWTDSSTKRLYESYNYPHELVVCSEAEAPEGSLMPAIPNIHYENGVITWSPFVGDGFYNYRAMIISYDETTNGTSFSIKDSLDNHKKDSGIYYCTFYAEDSSNHALSRKYCYEYEYESPFTQLANPSNLRWEGIMTAVWDPVPNAMLYTVYTYDGSSSGTYYRQYTTTNTSYDLSGLYDYGSGHTYYFSVVASADGYIDSYTRNNDDGKVGWFTQGTLSNVSLSKTGILSWDAYDGATYYQVLLAGGGFKVYDENSADLKIKARQLDLIEGNDYFWSITAVKTIDGKDYYITTTTSSETEGRYVYEENLTGDIDGDGYVIVSDLRILLQEVINHRVEIEWTDDQKAKMDLNGDFKIDVTDIRVLLQIIINQ